MHHKSLSEHKACSQKCAYVTALLSFGTALVAPKTPGVARGGSSASGGANGNGADLQAMALGAAVVGLGAHFACDLYCNADGLRTFDAPGHPFVLTGQYSHSLASRGEAESFIVQQRAQENLLQHGAPVPPSQN